MYLYLKCLNSKFFEIPFRNTLFENFIRKESFERKVSFRTFLFEKKNWFEKKISNRNNFFFFQPIFFLSNIRKMTDFIQTENSYIWSLAPKSTPLSYGGLVFINKDTIKEKIEFTILIFNWIPEIGRFFGYEYRVSIPIQSDMDMGIE